MSNRDLSRRRFLALSAGMLAAGGWRYGPAALADDRRRADRPAPGSPAGAAPTIGIALGAGGANGLAHILMLEALDEMGIRPHRISGSSIGAIIGALYASGIRGKQIRELVGQFIISPDEGLVEELLNRDALRWVEFLEIDLGHGGLLSSEGFIAFLYDTLRHDRFEDLEIPLRVVAADLWDRREVVLDSGALLPAIKASMALPGVFEPAVIDGRVLIDGGTVNPVPYDLLTGECDIVIGVDVSGKRTPPHPQEPSYFETIFNAAKVMQQAIMTEKRRRVTPAIYIAPRIVDVRALEFYRATQVFEQATPAKQELKRRLAALLEAVR
ncbi:MAG: patatin-like phospholipase family protein [Gammaproteobacteria bacterium]|jgi:NTE family protein